MTGMQPPPTEHVGAEALLFARDDLVAAAEFYRTHGYVGILDVVDEATCNTVREAIERAATVRERTTDPYFLRLDTDNSFNTSYRQYANLHEQDDILDGFVHSEDLGALAQAIAGEQLAFLFSSMLEKNPFAGPLRAHHDLRQMPFDVSGMITAWVALDDVDARNGCLYYLPGTHRMGVARAKDSARESFGDSSIAYLRFYGEFDDVSPAFAEVRRGTLLLHSGMTIHGSGANLSRTPRAALAVSFVSAEATCTNPTHPLLRDIPAGSRFADDPRHVPAVRGGST